MTMAPIVNDERAAAIRRDHPQWSDLSAVTYSWAGLHFPIPPVELDF
jgi:hypothetical protein